LLISMHQIFWFLTLGPSVSIASLRYLFDRIIQVAELTPECPMSQGKSLRRLGLRYQEQTGAS